METSNGVDIYHEWYNQNIVSAGSSVTIESGSEVVFDYSIDASHGPTHFNARPRVAKLGEKLKGKKLGYVFGDLHFVDLEMGEVGSKVKED